MNATTIAMPSTNRRVLDPPEVIRDRQRAPTEAISLRIPRATLAAYRATGRGWQTRMIAALDRSAKRLSTCTRP